ncbi:MAG TPA: ABC transporter ATP-binding protein, partial [Actinobacteria bacterium]|nr:ABC transporter ATP-binding protein [Actinomycetota bacterium]
MLLGVLGTIFIISTLSVVPALLIRSLLDDALPDKDVGLLTWLGIGMVSVPLINAIVGSVQRWMSSKAGEGIIYDLRRSLYRHLQGMSMRFFTSTKTGELVSRIDNDVVGAQSAITGTFVTIISNIVSLTVILVVMLRADWRLTLLAVAALPLFVLPARRVGKILRKVTQQQMEHNASMGAILHETFNVSGALLVKLFNRADAETEKFSIEAAAVRDLGVRRATIGRWFFAALGLVSAVGTAAVFWVGGYLVIQGRLTDGTVVMFATLLSQLYGPLAAMSNARVEFATSLVSFERVFEVLDLDHDITEVDEPVRVDRLEGAITFDHVSFRYQTDGPTGLEATKRFHPAANGDDSTSHSSTREWALEDIDFSIEAGSLTALVGPSGAGKTTISYLVPRLYDVQRGRISIDGHDLRSLKQSDIAAGIGVVTQETYLFHDTIGANLRYAKEDATLAELETATRAANIYS